MSSPTADEATRRRLIGVMFGANAFSSTAYISTITVASIVGATFTGSPSLAGVPSTVATVGTAIGAIVLAWAGARIGRRRSHTIGFLVAGVGHFGGRVPLTEERQLHGLLQSECLGHEVGGRPVRGRPDVDVGEGEEGALGGHHEVTSGSQAHAGPRSRPLHGGQHRLGHATHGEHHGVQRVDVVEDRRSGVHGDLAVRFPDGQERLHVAPGHEVVALSLIHI